MILCIFFVFSSVVRFVLLLFVLLLMIVRLCVFCLISVLISLDGMLVVLKLLIMIVVLLWMLVIVDWSDLKILLIMFFFDVNLWFVCGLLRGYVCVVCCVGGFCWFLVFVCYLNLDLISEWWVDYRVVYSVLLRWVVLEVVVLLNGKLM